MLTGEREDKPYNCNTTHFVKLISLTFILTTGEVECLLDSSSAAQSSGFSFELVVAPPCDRLLLERLIDNLGSQSAAS